jgi:hypothetical protein
MTTITWIYIVGAVLDASIVTVAFFGIRSQRARLRRQHLMPAVLTAIPWLVLSLIFSISFSPVFPIFLLASVVGIYVPFIYWILKAPNDNHVA